MWIRVETRLAGNKKLWRAAALRGVSAECMAGHLVFLWGAVAEQAPSGDVSDVPDALLEAWAGWRGEPGAFATTFRDVFVTDGVIDGWEEYQGKLIARQDAERARWLRRKQRGASAETPRSGAGVSGGYGTERNGTTPPPPRVVHGAIEPLFGETDHEARTRHETRARLDEVCGMLPTADGREALKCVTRASRDPLAWLCEVKAVLDGMRRLDPHPTPDQVSLAITDMRTNGAAPEAALFRGYCESAARRATRKPARAPRPAPGHGELSPKNQANVAAIGEWLQGSTTAQEGAA